MSLVLEMLEIEGFQFDSLFLEPALETGILGELFELPPGHLKGLFDLLGPAQQRFAEVAALCRQDRRQLKALTKSRCDIRYTQATLRFSSEWS